MATEVETAQQEVQEVEAEAPKPDENHVEENKPAEESQSAEKIEDAVVDGESKKEENGSVPPKVILHQHPPCINLPSFLPASLKLETFMRMHNIPYENKYVHKLGSDKVKLPFIEYQGDKVQDANFCIKYLCNKFSLTPDSHLSAEQRAVAHAFSTMAEENTYWSLAYYRWVDNFNETKKYYSNLAPVVKDVRPKLDQNKCIKCMQAHGIGKHTKDEIYGIAEADLRAMSAYLGEKEFFIDTTDPSTVDCTLFGLLASVIYGAPESPQAKLIHEEMQNLEKFCDNMKLHYWLDWGDVCNEENAEKFKPQSRLSMKNKKKKTKTTDEKEGEAESDKADEKPAEEEKKEGEEEKPADATEEAAPEQEAASGETPKEEEGAKEESKEEAEPAKEEEKPAEPEQ